MHTTNSGLHSIKRQAAPVTGIARILLAVLLAGATVVAGCAPTFPACVREHARPQIIRWGVIHSDNTIEGYTLNAQPELFSFRQAAPSAQPVLTPLGDVDHALYCDRLDMVRRAFLDVQALNVPGETRRFVEFSNPANSLEMRAIWNPEYETVGNARFRAVYDSLESLRKQEE